MSIANNNYFNVHAGNDYNGRAMGVSCSMKTKIYTALTELYESKAISLDAFKALCNYKDIIVTILDKVSKTK